MAPRQLVAGLDLGGTKLLGVVLDPADPKGEPLLEERVPTPHEGVGVLVETLSAMVARLGDRSRAELDHGLHAAGLGAPGLVDRAGALRFGANLPGVTDFDFGGSLRQVTGLPVAVDNDAT